MFGTAPVLDGREFKVEMRMLVFLSWCDDLEYYRGVEPQSDATTASPSCVPTTSVSYSLQSNDTTRTGAMSAHSCALVMSTVGVFAAAVFLFKTCVFVDCSHHRPLLS